MKRLYRPAEPPPAPEWASLLDGFVGQPLTGVSRLAWHTTTGTEHPERGPVQLRFTDDAGLVFDSGFDWRLQAAPTTAGDDSWRDPYDHVWQSEGWLLRDASGEPPFAAVIGRAFLGWRELLDEVGDQIGVHLDFGAGVRLMIIEGEVSPEQD